VDPTRRRGGGALLGDRIRMNALDGEHVFFRSLATRGGRELPGGIEDIITACKAAGFDLVILETPGIGQGDGIKAALFAELNGVVKRPDAILATNTSSILVVEVAQTTTRPGQVVGLHFFNPAPVQKLVEVIPSVLTGPDTADRARAFVADVLGKTAITAPDRSGFVVNALLVPYLLSAIRMLEAGHATAGDIDTGMTLGCAHPMGPLRLADLIGLDTLKAIADSMYAEYKEPLYAAPPLLLRMTAAGLLGRKSGRGFYDYQEQR
jgi:3-hydroxybutyryl-CoA dehydrogenase